MIDLWFAVLLVILKILSRAAFRIDAGRQFDIPALEALRDIELNANSVGIMFRLNSEY